MAATVDSFTAIGGHYGGAMFDLLADGTFRTRTCCDTDSWTVADMERLAEWLTGAIQHAKGMNHER